MATDVWVFKLCGREFHRVGPAWAKARSPHDFLETGTCNRPEDEDLKVREGW